MTKITSNQSPLSYLGFQRIEPTDKLSHLVDCYWFINTSAYNTVNSTEYLHPDGGIGIILNYADPLSFEHNSHTDLSMLDGTNTRSRMLGLHGNIESVGIRFKPAGASLFFPIPLNEIKNETLSLTDIKIKNHSSLYSSVYIAKTIRSKVSAIENWLFNSLLSRQNISSIVLESLTYIDINKGTIPIALLAKKLGHNQRKMERLFNAQIGMTAKEYSRNLRIADARSCIKAKHRKSLTEISYDLGYYDQSHFNSQFKNVVGMTPRMYSTRHVRKLSR